MRLAVCHCKFNFGPIVSRHARVEFTDILQVKNMHRSLCDTGINLVCWQSKLWFLRSVWRICSRLSTSYTNWQPLIVASLNFLPFLFGLCLLIRPSLFSQSSLPGRCCLWGSPLFLYWHRVFFFVPQIGTHRCLPMVRHFPGLQALFLLLRLFKQLFHFLRGHFLAPLPCRNCQSKWNSQFI